MTKFTCILFLIFIATCRCDEFSDRNELEHFYHTVGEYTLNLLRFTYNDSDVEDLLVSPISVWNLLAALDVGAEGNKETQGQISQVLIQQSNKTAYFLGYEYLKRALIDTRVQNADLHNHNFVFLNQSFRMLKKYEETIKNKFDAVIHTLDFTDDKRASEEANRIIESYLPRILRLTHPENFHDTLMIMCNGIFFNGFWKKQFPILATVEEEHYDEELKTTRYVKRMHLKAKMPNSDIPYLNSTVLELPIGDEGKWIMLFIFPYQDVPLSYVFDQLRKYSLETLIKILNKDEIKEVDIKLPRFRLERQLLLNTPLGHMGISDAFKLDLQGGFLGIATEDIYIGDIEHMASIIVSETGVRALSTTPGFDGYTSKAHNGGFKAKKPFIFLLMEKPSKIPVFCGTYTFERYF